MTQFSKILTRTLLVSTLSVVPMMSAAPASAQVAGVAVADPETAILTARALETANASIATTYKAQLDQVRARQVALNAELTTIAAPLDTNHDKQISDAELAAAEAAKNPILARIKTAQAAGQAEIGRLNAPAVRAQAYAIEQIAQQYPKAMNTVVTAKKISLLIGANTVQFAQPTVDVSDDIKAELDRSLPTVSITPPANWQPQQQTVQLLQQYQQVAFAQAQQRAQAPGGAAPARPATRTPAPQGR